MPTGIVDAEQMILVPGARISDPSYTVGLSGWGTAAMDPTSTEAAHPWLGVHVGSWSYGGDPIVAATEAGAGVRSGPGVPPPRVIVTRSSSAVLVEVGSSRVIAEVALREGERVGDLCTDGREVTWLSLHNISASSMRLVSVSGTGVLRDVALPGEVAWMPTTCMRAGGIAGVPLEGSRFFWYATDAWREWPLALPVGSTFSSVVRHTSTVLWLFDMSDVIAVPLLPIWAAAERTPAPASSAVLEAMPDLCSDE